MKIVSFNVNGVRSVATKDKDGTKHPKIIPNNTLVRLLKDENVDVLCLQEIKCDKNVCIESLIDWKSLGYDFIYQNSAERKGYSGTAVISRLKPVNVIYNFGDFNTDKNFNDEGRVLTVEFDKVFIVTVYTPNSKADLSRLSYRTKEWDVLFGKFIDNLQKKKPVVACGDLNVAHEEIDLANPKKNMKTHGFTIEERTAFGNILKDYKLVDTFRLLHPTTIKYSWFSAITKSRAKNVGWRIDYLIVSESLKSKVRSSDILSDYYGSDHVPVLLDLHL